MDNHKPQSTGPATVPLANLSKRQQVAKANKSIFVWVAAAAAVVALSLVLLQFLVRVGLFNQKIINEKSQTNQTIVQNTENAKQLKQNVDALIADSGLSVARANAGDNNLRVILDALPTTGDTTSLSNSLYSRVVGPAGVRIESVASGSLDGAAVVEVIDPTVTPVGLTGPQMLPFTISIAGDVTATKNALLNLEKTIRPMNITMLDIKNASGILTTTITGETYYIPAGNTDLGKKVITP